MKGKNQFSLPSPPKIPNYTVSILNYGAVGDGRISNTKPIQQAINDCVCHGGGRVVFPKGIWFTGPIHLESNIELHLESEAVIQFSPEESEYLPPVYTSFEGIRCYNYSPLIYGRNIKNVAITGTGTIDGNGKYWWGWKQNILGISEIYTACMQGTPVEKRLYASKEYGLRPCFVQFVESENILIEDITICNSPFWNVHPIWCKNVIIRGLKLNNPYESPNTDSVNIESCSNVLVEGCTIFEGGDDCFTIKSGRGRDGWEVGIPCENVTIRECSAYHVRGGGVVIGSEMSGGVRNISAYNCKFDDIASGVKIKSKKGRGGYVKNVTYSNMDLGKVKYVINITLKYPYDDQFAGNNATELPEISYIYFNDFSCVYALNSIQIEGIEESIVRNIKIKDINIKKADHGLLANCVENLDIVNVNIG